MRKQLMTDAIQNELQGASLFFRRPQPQPATQKPPVGTPAPADPLPPAGAATAQPPGSPANTAQREQAQTPVRSSAPPSVRPGGRRRLTRVPFEFYQDQIETLRRLSLQAKLRGEKGSMSEMVRAAVDRHLASLPPDE